MATFPRHAAALASARKDIGTAEQPPGSNTGPRVRTYQQATWLRGTGWPWCVAFCVYHWKSAGFILPYLGAGAYAFLDWARAHGWTCKITDAVPGDGVVFNVGSGHMAMLARRVSPGDRTIHTVDGNVSNRVDVRERDLRLVRGIVHIPEKAAPRPPEKPPVFEVVTSASGQKVVYVSGARAVGRKLGEILKKYPAGVTIRRRRKP